MINNYSYLDGLKVIMGNVPTNLVALIILLIYALPPDYDGDEERESKAKAIFAQLVIGHILFALDDLLEHSFFAKIAYGSVVLIIYQVVIAIQICHNWYFLPEEQMMEIKKTEEQRLFFFVLALELMTMAQFIFSTICYICFSMIQRPVL